MRKLACEWIVTVTVQTVAPYNRPVYNTRRFSSLHQAAVCTRKWSLIGPSVNRGGGGQTEGGTQRLVSDKQTQTQGNAM